MEGFQKVIMDVAEERRRQDSKWGIQNHGPGTWALILLEELGEAAKAFLENKQRHSEIELTQTASVIIAWLELLQWRRSENEDVRRVSHCQDGGRWSVVRIPPEEGMKTRESCSGCPFKGQETSFCLLHQKELGERQSPLSPCPFAKEEG